MKELDEENICKIEKLHNIYCMKKPDFITELDDCIELQRLKGVGQNCGDDYLNEKIQSFSFNYSRYDHSVGVALIIWRFTKNIKMSLAGLFHDIATPTFAHVIDFLNNDAEKQTSTEDGTESIINNSKQILKILKKYNLKTEDVSDYSKYSIADNKSPKLSSDRLEYTLYMGVSRNLITMEEVEKIINDIIIVNNEFGEEEMCFQNKEIAEKFTKVALDNGKFMSGGISNLSNQLLADILKLALKDGILSKSDFWKFTEEEVVEKINNSKNEEINKLWNTFKKFENVYENKVLENMDDQYIINVKVKRRYIDPLCKIKDKQIRISKISNEIAQNIENFINMDKNIYYSVKYVYGG